MDNQQDVLLLPEDRVKLTKEQRNLITLALEKQLPPEDAEFLESTQQNKHKIGDPYEKIHNYYIKKYGNIFGKIYVSAITGDEEKCMRTINEIEKLNALKRIKKEKSFS